MERTEIVSKLQGIFRNVLESDSFTISDNLTANDVEGWDSLSHMMILSEIEKHFSVKFKFADIRKMKNIGDMIEAIARQKEAET
jgi:acyl carrier protein